MGLPRATFRGLEGIAAFYDDLLAGLEAVPGVVDVGGVSCLPLEGWCRGDPLAVAGRVEPSTPPVVALRRATERYFEVAGIEILRGRALEAGDYRTGSRAAVISAELADLYFPGEDPIGQRVFPGRAPSDEGRWFTVVGVVENVPAVTLSDPADPLIYFPVVGDPSELSILSLRFLVRAKDPLSLVPAIRRTIASINSTMAISGVRTMAGIKREASAQTVFTMVILGIAASVAMLLGAVGIYGVLAYVVGQRSAEIGLRMALGARPAGVGRMILLQGGRLVGLGLVVGLAAAAALSRALDSLLFSISPTDPLTYVGVSALLLVAAGAAVGLPAWRAAALDPAQTLR
jgi:putative ABC transport system permease protein